MNSRVVLRIMTYALLLTSHWSLVRSQMTGETSGSNGQYQEVIQRVLDVTLLGPLIEGSELTNYISDNCSKSLQTLRNALIHQEQWALSMLDASGKVGSDVNSGKIFFPGSYKECSQIKGKFCQPTVAFTNNDDRNKTGNFGSGIYMIDVCLPTDCSDDDIFMTLLSGLQKLQLTTFNPPRCHVEKNGLEPQQVIAIVIFTLLAFLVIGGTAIDILRTIIGEKYSQNAFDSEPIQNRNKSTLEEFLVAFSMYSNAKKVLSTDSPGASLTALNGIRFLSTTWIILYHCFYHFGNITANGVDFSNNRFKFAFQVVLNGLISVDTFFFLGGLLVVYVNLRKLQKTTEYSLWQYFQYFTHRVWRLTPPVIFAILFVFIWPLMGSGPNWATNTQADYQGCSENWFSNLLYFNNFYGLKKPCMDHLWYLANDMQFYLLAPIVFYYLYKSPKIGLILNASILMASLVISFALGAIYNLQATTLFFLDFTKLFQGFSIVYTKPYCRVGPYCLGMFLGYVLATKKRVTLKPSAQFVGWCLSLLCCVSTVYGVYNWNKGLEGNRYVNSLYLSVHRSVWALGVAWVCFVCALGYGGIVNKILSWKAFVPLSKLTYVAYIIHPFIVKGLAGIQADKIVINIFLWVILYVGIVCVSFAIAFPVTLCIEVPFVALEKIVFPCFKDKRGTTRDGSEPISIISPANYRTIDQRIPTNPRDQDSNVGLDNEGFIEENSDVRNSSLSNGSFRP